MKARAVIGANFGDEGKGLVVDHLCATQGADAVVRYNGGAQAGHTVVTPEGERHVFHHFGSGTFVDVPTFLSSFFVCNPALFVQEWKELAEMGIRTQVFADPDCLVTTVADMLINQHLEKSRGNGRHGSCGVGFGETIERSLRPDLRVTMRDIWDWNCGLRETLERIFVGYMTERTGHPVIDSRIFDRFCGDCFFIANMVSPAPMTRFGNPIFEGAQGLLLDQDNKEFFPHVTRSNTGTKNIRALCYEARIDEIETYYVSRTYLTRHGAGPLPGEDADMRFEDNTNLQHPWQGQLRFAPLDIDSLRKRCAADCGQKPEIIFTHCDQIPAPCYSALQSYGPTRYDIRRKRP
jgi:adenylosuccinate synthase